MDKDTSNPRVMRLNPREIADYVHATMPIVTPGVAPDLDEWQHFARQHDLPAPVRAYLDTGGTIEAHRLELAGTASAWRWYKTLSTVSEVTIAVSAAGRTEWAIGCDTTPMVVLVVAIPGVAIATGPEV